MPTIHDTSSPTPIYEDLVAEHGDVIAASREAAERSQREASQALDWSELHRGRPRPSGGGAPLSLG